MIQDVINKSARVIIEIQKNTFIEILLVKANLRNVKIILDFKQKKFSVKSIVLPDENLAKNILLIIFRKKDGSVQSIK